MKLSKQSGPKARQDSSKLVGTLIVFLTSFSTKIILKKENRPSIQYFSSTETDT